MDASYIILFLVLVYFFIFIRPLGFLHVATVYLVAHFLSSKHNTELYGFGQSADDILLFGFIAICFGHIIFLLKKKNTLLIKKSDYRVSKTRLSSVVLIFALVIIYHYAVGGIPLFSSNILFDRFESNSSGFFGIPGRFNLFGGVFIFFLAYAAFTIKGKEYKNIFFITLIILLISMLFKGSKGTLIHFLVAILICRSVITQDTGVRNRGPSSKILIPLGALIAISFVWISNIHISTGVTRYTNLFDLLITRVIEISGEGYFHAVTSFVNENGFGFGGNSINDMITFVSRLTGVGEQYYTLEKVSALSTGSTIGLHYIVPVELNIFGYMYMELGLAGVFLIGSLIGFSTGNIGFEILNCYSIKRITYLMFMQFFLFLLIIKGDLIFLIITMGISYLMFIIICKIFLSKINA
tara:strand:- start:2949 stop:4181 length:1233 start_codon:yes stop_codon:yes gene_type:complete